jgi:hypothetical protein
MTVWNTLPGERTELYSPIGLRPVDEMTGLAPIGRVRPFLDVADGAGGWQRTDIKAVVTLSGVITYPRLELRSIVTGASPRHYRILISADFYRPLYPTAAAGIEFDAYPYNHSNPPQTIVSQIQDLFLTPATNYPFPSHISILRGIVIDAAGKKVSDALVTQGAKERVLTDDQGAFALPLRWVPKNVPVSINASDQRTSRTGSINITVPADLGKNGTITIS